VKYLAYQKMMKVTDAVAYLFKARTVEPEK
jgi:hypothetical protein